jgi:glycosyltransferase involved in cell wall biosynthesis
VITEKPKPRVVIVSPFLDRNYGTERHLVEWVIHLADAFEFHIYSQRIKDVDLSKVTWHRIPKLPGPHLLNFIWWFFANHLWRRWDRHFRGLRPDLVFSPGPNCLDADVISVHIIFAEYARKNEESTRLSRHPISIWPRLMHRQLYYKLAMLLERSVYTRKDIQLVLIARRTFVGLKRFYGRNDFCPILYTGLDHGRFNPENRVVMRENARKELGLEPGVFAVLLIGNDWFNKGVPVLLDALAQLADLPINLLIVSREDSAPVRALGRDRGLDGRIHFLPPRADVEFYYSAADAYAGPSLEDTFALPPAEAMACGLPVIVSAENGTSEIITHGVDGMILKDPRDATGLAQIIRRIQKDDELRRAMGENAARVAKEYTWERNGHELTAIFNEVLIRKSRPSQQTLAQRF